LRNLETKARCSDLGKARQRAIELGATEHGRVRQVDTYYAVPRGRLKLRLQSHGPSQLVYYHRPNVATARWSDYQLVDVPAADALAALLDRALGRLKVVDKTRTLLLYGNTRIHLDLVEGLGEFVELETVMRGQSEADAAAEHGFLCRALGIGEGDVVAGSYADMLHSDGEAAP